MPAFLVQTATQRYEAIVERGVLATIARHVPKSSKQVFVVTTQDVWGFHGPQLAAALDGVRYEVLYFPGGEERKRLSEVEALAEQMVAHGADRSSVVIGFGGGIVTDVAGFLAASFLRGIPVIQVPTTLVGQSDAAVGGKTGVNLVGGKNLMGAFHQPLVVLIDPDVLRTLPEREYRAGLYEVIKCGVIRSPELFELLERQAPAVLSQQPAAVEQAVCDSVRIKCEVVTADEKEGDLRRILNFGHTIGHALEAETHYTRFLHGEAVAFGMNAATQLAHLEGLLSEADTRRILAVVRAYGPIPALDGITPAALLARLGSDKKTLHGKVHFVLPVCIGEVVIRSGISIERIEEATRFALTNS
jgi:3-dehydroquinate synthase